jgi:hypothetical protein
MQATLEERSDEGRSNLLARWQVLGWIYSPVQDGKVPKAALQDGHTDRLSWIGLRSGNPDVFSTW